MAQLRAALRGLLGSDGAVTLASPDSQWRGQWPELAAMGLTSFCVPEDRGGFGRRADAAAAAASELGAALHGSPFAALTAATHVLATSADPDADDLVADLLAGQRVCAFGHFDQSRRRAHLLDGVSGAEAVLLADTDRDEFILFTDPSAWVMDPVPHGFDVSRQAADLVVDAATGRIIPACAAGDRLHGLLLAADTLGGVQRALDRTVDYAGQRQAFGRSIGGFQAVQHRLADHAVRVRGMRLLVNDAARAIDADDPTADRAVALAALSVHSGATGVLHDLVQLTGAIGFTWEYGLHHYQRRAHQNARLAGGTRSAASALAIAEGWRDAG
ncbi:MAG: acyl-CoA dehydrogenase family protein [Acidimicrobiales bacterium]|nr:acyl-CoA dehydrogenase family protein [Acidimicrobiales bacterium]